MPTRRDLQILSTQQIFHQSQFNKLSHPKYINILQRKCNEMELDTFTTEFICCLRALFAHGDKGTYSENMMQFATKFVVSLMPSSYEVEEEEIMPMGQFLNKLYGFIFMACHAGDVTVRLRATSFICKLLRNCDDKAYINEDLSQKLTYKMLERLKDKSPAIRVQAVLALHRLQNISSPDCPIIEALSFHLNSDPMVTVRRAVIKVLAKTRSTVLQMMDRTRDNDGTVVCEAYFYLTNLHIKALSIKLREQLTSEGLAHRLEAVKKVVEDLMLPRWLNDMKGNYLDLMHALDCERTPKRATLVLRALFKHTTVQELVDYMIKLQTDKLVPLDKLNPDVVMFWLCLAQFLQEKYEEEVEQILPELTSYCNYVRSYELLYNTDSETWERLQHSCVMKCLLDMVKLFDLSDEVGRSHLAKLMRDMLQNPRVGDDIVSSIMPLLESAVPNLFVRLHDLDSIILDLYNPETIVESTVNREMEVQEAKLRVTRNELTEAFGEAQRNRDFTKVSALSLQLGLLDRRFADLADLAKQQQQQQNEEQHATARQLSKTPKTLLKCMTIIYEMLQPPSITTLPAQMEHVIDHLIPFCIESNVPTLVAMTVKVLTACSLLNKTMAMNHLVNLFSLIAMNDDRIVYLTAVKGIIDLYMYYGLEGLPVAGDTIGGDKKEEKQQLKKKGVRLLDTTTANTMLETDSEGEICTPTGTETSSLPEESSNALGILYSMLDSTWSDMRSCVAEGLCKLLLAKRLESPNLVSRLVIMWYSPISGDDPHLRQVLGMFFSEFCCRPFSAVMLEQCFVPTLLKVMKAPPTSPLASIDLDSLTKFLVNLTRPDANTESQHSHNNLALSLCNEVLLDPEENDLVMIKALTKLILNLDDKAYRDSLSILIDKVQAVVERRACQLYIRKFKQQLQKGQVEEALAGMSIRDD